MSFAWAFLDESFFLEKAKLDPDKFHKQKALTKESAEKFLVDIRLLARKYPKKLFILRPHPFEKEETYRDYLNTLTQEPVENNILVLQEGNVYEWIKTSDLVIGWLTTVSVEASIFNKRILYIIQYNCLKR